MPIPDRPIFNVVPDRPDARDYRVMIAPPPLHELPPRVDLWEQGVVPEIWIVGLIGVIVILLVLFGVAL